MQNELSISEKYNLTIEEAACYFRIGENKLRALAGANPDADYILHIGSRTLFKRVLFEKYIDSVSCL